MTHEIHPLAIAIRDRRKVCRLSVREAAKLTGVSHSWLDKQERGVVPASPLRLDAVLRALEGSTRHSSIVEMVLRASNGHEHRLAQMAPGLLILHEPAEVPAGPGEVTLTVDGTTDHIPVEIVEQKGSRLILRRD